MLMRRMARARWGYRRFEIASIYAAIHAITTRRHRRESGPARSSSVDMLSRRRALQFAALGSLGVAALGGHRWLRRSTPRDGDELLDILEHTDRDRVLERIAARVGTGAEPAALRDALLVAAARHVVPRTTFSKPHHALISVHAIHRAGERLPAAQRWHPLLWAVDDFKAAQAASADAESAPLQSLGDAALPPAASADHALVAALDDFDGARAEAAMVALHRAGRRDRIVELVLRYGSRDLRHIGHKAIHVTSTLQTLRYLGWERGEPPLRSTAWTLALHYTEDGRDLDGTWLRNQRALSRLGADWSRGTSHGEVPALIATLRQASPDDAASEVAARLQRGASVQAVWDAMLLSGAELMFNNPTSVEALHAVTASNAARSAFEMAPDDATRGLLLLQNAARVADFHRYTAHWAVKRGRPPAFSLAIDQLEPTGVAGAGALDDIFADVGKAPADRMRAAQRSLAYLSTTPDGASSLAVRALELVSSRAIDTHDFKLPMAAIEDAARISAAWRPRYLAACTARFRGTADPRAPIADRIDDVTRRLA
jgi:hypothetical protein